MLYVQGKYLMILLQKKTIFAHTYDFAHTYVLAHKYIVSPNGQKYEQCLKWNTHVVNHLWVEDCYQKRTMQKEGRPSYQVYAKGLTDIVGHFWIPRRTPIPPEVEEIIKLNLNSEILEGVRWLNIIRSKNLDKLMEKVPSLCVNRNIDINSKQTDVFTLSDALSDRE